MWSIIFCYWLYLHVRLSLSEGFMEVIRRKANNQGSMSNDEWDLLDRKALERIWLCLVSLVAFNITKAKTIEDENPSDIVWKALHFKQGISHEVFI